MHYILQDSHLLNPLVVYVCYKNTTLSEDSTYRLRVSKLNFIKLKKLIKCIRNFFRNRESPNLTSALKSPFQFRILGIQI